MTKAHKGTMYHDYEPNAYAGINNNKFFSFLFSLGNVWILWKQHNYKANYIKAEADSNILLQANWQETSRSEYIKIKHLKFNPLHKTILLYKLRPKQQVQGTTGPNIITKQSLQLTLPNKDS